MMSLNVNNVDKVLGVMTNTRTILPVKCKASVTDRDSFFHVLFTDFDDESRPVEREEVVAIPTVPEFEDITKLCLPVSIVNVVVLVDAICVYGFVFLSTFRLS